MSAPSTPDSRGGAGWPGAATQPDPRRWWILAVIAIAQLMIVLDATIMNIALPSAQRALHFSLADRQWVVTAYALAFGSLLLLGGKLADVVGRKVMFLTGMTGFAAASAVGGAAVSFPMLISARAVQGGFAAVLAPTALSLLATTFTDPDERRQSFAVYGAVAGSGGAVGLVLGGILTEYLSWRWCLYVNVLFAAVAGIGAAVLLGRDVPGRRPRVDVLGAALVSGGMFCIVYGFSNAATHSWGTPSTWAFIAAGVVLLAGFVAWEARAPEPLLPLRIVADRTRAGAYLAMLFAGAGMFGILLFLNYYMQQSLGYSPVITGLAFLPMVALVMMVGQLANVVLMPRTGPRPLIAAGMLLGGTSAALLTRLGPHSSYAGYILPSVLLIGAGLGFIFAPSADTGTAGVPSAGHRGGLGHRQHRQPARRVDRHLAAEHHLRHRHRHLDRGQRPRPARPAAARPGRPARLHRRVLVDRGHLRRRRGHLRRAAALRPADPPGPARPAGRPRRRPRRRCPGRLTSCGAGSRARAPLSPGTRCRTKPPGATPGKQQATRISPRQARTTRRSLARPGPVGIASDHR